MLGDYLPFADWDAVGRRNSGVHDRSVLIGFNIGISFTPSPRPILIGPAMMGRPIRDSIRWKRNIAGDADNQAQESLNQTEKCLAQRPVLCRII